MPFGVSNLNACFLRILLFLSSAEWSQNLLKFQFLFFISYFNEYSRFFSKFEDAESKISNYSNNGQEESDISEHPETKEGKERQLPSKDQSCTLELPPPSQSALISNESDLVDEEVLEISFFLYFPSYLLLC